MEVICRDVREIDDVSFIKRFEDKYDIEFSKDFISFMKLNNGGIPLKKQVELAGDLYEVRCFLSFFDDEYNSIGKPLESFQKKTKGKIIPFAIDSGDNYFCLNLDTEKIYYWDREDDLFYLLSNSFTEFVSNLL